MTRDSLGDFTIEPFTHNEQTKQVYWLGEGPAVVIMSEIPGITPSVADFARRLAGEGFRVAVPHLFGEPGREPTNGYVVSTLAKACVSSEFVAFAKQKTSPVSVWLRGLVAEAARRSGTDDQLGSVGVVGMCFTGGFALALAVDPLVGVPVMSQPSLPLPVLPGAKADLGLTPDDLDEVKRRADASEICAVGLRFTGDPLVPAARFERLRAELGDRFVGVEIDSSSGNQHQIAKMAHSVLTEDFSSGPDHPTLKAYETVVFHFKTQLGNTPEQPPRPG